MGGMTSNGKRSEECLNVNHTHSSPNSSDFRKSKRLRFSFIPQNTSQLALPSNSTVSRISRYPEAKAPLSRRPLGPCSRREWKCRASGMSEETHNDMGNLYDKITKTKEIALHSLRYVGKGKDKDVIDVDTDSQKDAVSEDSSIEEVVNIEDGRTAGPVIEIQDSENKDVDGGLQQQSTSSVVSELNNSSLKVDIAGKSLEALSINPERDGSGLLAYKKLLQEVVKRDDKISSLTYEIRLNEKRLLPFETWRPEKKPEQVNKFYLANLYVVH